MKRRILYLKLVGSEDDRRNIEKYLEESVSEGFEVEARLIKNPFPDLEYHCYCSLIARDVLREVVRAEREGFSAVIIGCFYDPLLDEARELALKIAVVAPCQASLHVASLLGSSISIIYGRDKHLPRIKELAAKYGFASRIASYRCLDLCVEELYGKRQLVEERLLKVARQAVVEDKAEVVVLGCTALYNLHRALQRELKVPAVDPVLASLKIAELLTVIGEEFEWRHSKRGVFEAPPFKELERVYEQLGLSQ